MFKITLPDRIWEIQSPQIMAIMNATADSFYAASRVNDENRMMQKVDQFIKEGATLIDIGGQSTRPGASQVTLQNEIDQILPIVNYIHSQYPDILISIDTFNSVVADKALDNGAHIINDISCGSFDDNMLNVVANHKAGYIGMHITGNFDTMHEVVNRHDIMEEIADYFKRKVDLLATYGIENWVIDPGFGFGKTITENFTIVKDLKKILPLGLPILLGVSRKSSIYKTLNVSADEALNGTTVLNTIGIQNGANIIRVHDVLEAQQIISLGQHLF